MLSLMCPPFLEHFCVVWYCIQCCVIYCWRCFQERDERSPTFKALKAQETNRESAIAMRSTHAAADIIDEAPLTSTLVQHEKAARRGTAERSTGTTYSNISRSS